MVFSSFVFVCIFVPITLILYYAIPKMRGKNIVLMLASLLFYAWGGYRYLPILLSVVAVNYIGGVLINKINTKKFNSSEKKYRLKQLVLFISIVLNLAILGYFKYFDFFIININRILKTEFELQHIVLPIGISFFTFQGMSYVIDVYRGTNFQKEDNEKLRGCEVQKNPFKLLLYISFFPQLIAGPIVRYKDVMGQISVREHTIDKVAQGLHRFIYGLAKKVIIADMLGLIADKIFMLEEWQTASHIAWIGAICYTLQIYFDFMGYSDMAIGLAKCFGFSFLENFNYPYISKSITEFWRRWHMSLSSWFRDYVYIPLGGNRKGNVYINLLIVFVLTGLWHGAQWSFVAWGLWHGIFILAERWGKMHLNFLNKIPDFIKWMYTMGIVTIGWVLFRAHSLKDGLVYIKAMFGLNAFEFQPFGIRYYLNNRVLTVFIIAMILSLVPAKAIRKKIQDSKGIEVFFKVWSIILLVVCLIVMANSSYSPFIYFRF